MKKFLFQLTAIMAFSLSIGNFPSYVWGEELTLVPGAALEVRFSVSMEPVICRIEYDVIVLAGGAPIINSSVAGARVEFLDGATSLGSAVESDLQGFFPYLWARFQSPDSLFECPGSTVIDYDFSSIRDKTIDGIFRLTIESGEAVIDSEALSIRTTRGRPNEPGSSCSEVGYCPQNQPIITSVAIVPVGPPVDTDGDGILDHVDLCPNDFGEEVNGGCPISPSDRDGDGILNEADECPDVFGSAAHAGCPSPRPIELSNVDLVTVRATFDAFRRGRTSRQWEVFPSAIVKNHGSVTSGRFSILFTIGGRRQAVSVNSLAPGESLVVTPSRDQAGRGLIMQVGEYILRVVADSHQQINELDESNNVYEVPVVLSGD